MVKWTKTNVLSHFDLMNNSRNSRHESGTSSKTSTTSIQLNLTKLNVHSRHLTTKAMAEIMGEKLKVPCRLVRIANLLHDNFLLRGGSPATNKPSFIETEAQIAACLYLACKLEKVERPFLEISMGTNYANIIEIGRAYKKICKVLKIDSGTIKLWYIQDMFMYDDDLFWIKQ